MNLFAGQRKWSDGNIFQRHSLGITLITLMTVQTAHALWAGHRVWLDNATGHGQRASGWPSEFWVWWSWEYQVSLVADTFGALLLVMLSKYLYEKGSSESNEEKDPDLA